MSAVSQRMACRRLPGYAAVVAVMVPLTLLGACADQTPPPPPPAPMQVAPPPPPPSPPAPVPPARG